MPLDFAIADLVVGIVGCGTMGAGIAQIAAAGGARVLMLDERPGAAVAAVETIRTGFSRLVERGKLDGAQAAEALERLRPVADLGAMAKAHLVIEAIVEALEPKRALMRALEDAVGERCVLATNTSSLSVTAIAAACAHPGRVAGFHFFNPVPLMKVVEIIDGARTAPAVGDALMALARRMGHHPVRAKDTPGFIVNHAGRGFGTESLKILGEGVSDPPTIDRVLKEACGFRMGPFELLDLTGLDVSQPVMESIYRQYYEEPRYRPSPIARQRLDAGLLGRKSGAGFYTYAGGQIERADAPSAPAMAQRVSAWLAEGHDHGRIAAIIGASGRLMPDPAAAEIIILPLLGEDASTAAHRLKVDPTRALGIDAVFGIDTHRTLVATPATEPRFQSAARALFSADGIPASVIRDSTGALGQRVVALIVNIACDIAQQRIATPQDIDAAVRLGLGYPRGPLAWGDLIGPRTILAILEKLQALTGDPRYRPSPWLRRRAQLGLSLLHLDT